MHQLRREAQCFFCFFLNRCHEKEADIAQLLEFKLLNLNLMIIIFARKLFGIIMGRVLPD